MPFGLFLFKEKKSFNLWVLQMNELFHNITDNKGGKCKCDHREQRLAILSKSKGSIVQVTSQAINQFACPSFNYM